MDVLLVLIRAGLPVSPGGHAAAQAVTDLPQATRRVAQCNEQRKRLDGENGVAASKNTGKSHGRFVYVPAPLEGITNFRLAIRAQTAIKVRQRRRRTVRDRDLSSRHEQEV